MYVFHMPVTQDVNKLHCHCHIHPIHRYFIVVLANNQKFVGIGLFSYLKCTFIWAK